MSLNLTSSIWIKPLNLNRWEIKDQLRPTILYCALSSTYAYNLGCNLTMHCDPEIYDVLKLLPYSNIYPDIENIEKRIKYVTPLQFWASSKAIAFEKEGTGVIHIDNDVFLTKPEVLDELDIFQDKQYDCIYQHIELGNYKRETAAWTNVINNVDWNQKRACCVGVLGFNNDELLTKYLDNYHYWQEHLPLIKDMDPHASADLVCEQKYLYELITNNGYNGKSLLGDQFKNTILELQQRSDMLGYQHILGPAKYGSILLRRNKKRLMKLNPKLYDKIEQYI